MRDQGVDLQFRETRAATESRCAVTSRGFYIETVEFVGPCSFAYSWQGKNHYLASHDLRLLDGETTLDALPRTVRFDLRGRLTFAPGGCRVSGWSSLAARVNSYTALTFEPGLVEQEREVSAGRQPRPLLYFQDPGLGTTLRKIGTALRQPGPLDVLYLETLGLLAVLEVDRLQRDAPNVPPPRRGRLAGPQERIVRDYIEEHLTRPLTLDELATLVKLSRYHFARSFKTTFGCAPRQYVLGRRLEHARTMLLTTNLLMSDVADLLGFGGPARFATIFRQHMGCTPSAFRRQGR